MFRGSDGWAPGALMLTSFGDIRVPRNPRHLRMISFGLRLCRAVQSADFFLPSLFSLRRAGKLSGGSGGDFRDRNFARHGRAAGEQRAGAHVAQRAGGQRLPDAEVNGEKDRQR